MRDYDHMAERLSRSCRKPIVGAVINVHSYDLPGSIPGVRGAGRIGECACLYAFRAACVDIVDDFVDAASPSLIVD